MGGAITWRLKVRNKGGRNGRFNVTMLGHSGVALFIGCKPRCGDLGEWLGAQVIQFKGPAPKTTKAYTVQFQALQPANITWGISFNKIDGESLDGNWSGQTLVLY